MSYNTILKYDLKQKKVINIDRNATKEKKRIKYQFKDKID
jgi:hypothetical protein